MGTLLALADMNGQSHFGDHLEVTLRETPKVVVESVALSFSEFEGALTTLTTFTPLTKGVWVVRVDDKFNAMVLRIAWRHWQMQTLLQRCGRCTDDNPGNPYPLN